MRYSRQERFIGKESQNILKNKIITIVGLGALGSNAANLIARAGINLILIDNDKVELTNLQRQNIFTEQDINKYKVEASEFYLKKVNSEIKIKTYNERLNRNNINLIKADLVLDCTDNLEIRFLINDFCCKNKIPFVHAAVIQNKGIIYNIIPGNACFNCIYRTIGDAERCEDLGIMNTIASLIASIQVNEAIKILLNKEYETNLIRVNLNTNEFERIKVNKNPKCEICNNKEMEKNFELKLCKTGATLTVKTNKQLNLEKIKNCFGAVRDAKITLLLEIENEQVIVNKKGEIIFKTLKDENKIMKIAKKIYDVGK
jgi:adenylyltransferase/sulfurtransferase